RHDAGHDDGDDRDIIHAHDTAYLLTVNGGVPANSQENLVPGKASRGDPHCPGENGAADQHHEHIDTYERTHHDKHIGDHSPDVESKVTQLCRAAASCDKQKDDHREDGSRQHDEKILPELVLHLTPLGLHC